MKKYLTILFLIVFITPSIAYASWWNPFSWKVFNKSTEVKTEKPVVITPSNQVSTSTKQIKVLKKIPPTSTKEDIKTNSISQKEENIDLKIEKCKATKESAYNDAILKLNQAINSRLQEIFTSLEQQYKNGVQKIHDNTSIQISRITNDSTLNAFSKNSLISQYNYSDSEQVKSLYENQQTFWKNQKTEVENSKQKAIDQINLLLSEEYSKCLSK